MKKRGPTRHWKYLIVPVSGILAVIGIAVFMHGKPVPYPVIDGVVPEASFQDLTGKALTIPEGCSGKIVLMHFWATSCPLCVRETLGLESLRRRYESRGVLPLSVNVGENKRVVLSYMRGIRVSYPILLDPDLSVARRYGIKGVPTTFVINREGILKFRIIGVVSDKELETMIRTLL